MSVHLYTGEITIYSGILGREKELTIKRMEYTWGEYRLNKGDALRGQNDAQTLNT